jgi:hypothetical protein
MPDLSPERVAFLVRQEYVVFSLLNAFFYGMCIRTHHSQPS